MVVVNIHNGNGSLIRHLANQPVSKGIQNFYWDGKDDGGSPVSTGLYLVMVRQLDGAAVIKKVLVLKQ
jgi:flagellar hook assembly protein FlgD